MQLKIGIGLIALTISSTSALAQESPKTRGIDCTELGVRYGKCALTVASGLAPRCPSEYDFVKPARCEKNGDFDKGIRLGTQEFEAILRQYRK